MPVSPRSMSLVEVENGALDTARIIALVWLGERVLKFLTRSICGMGKFDNASALGRIGKAWFRGMAWREFWQGLQERCQCSQVLCRSAWPTLAPGERLAALGYLVPRRPRLLPVMSAAGECVCLGGGPCGTAKQSGNRLFAVIIWTNSLPRSFSFILNYLCQLLYFYRLSSDKERG